jgi:hypothetical protein
MMGRTLFIAIKYRFFAKNKKAKMKEADFAFLLLPFYLKFIVARAGIEPATFGL